MVAKLKFTGGNVWLWKVFAIRSRVPPFFSHVVNQANMFQRNSYPAANEAVSTMVLRPRVPKLSRPLVDSSRKIVPAKMKYVIRVTGLKVVSSFRGYGGEITVVTYRSPNDPSTGTVIA